MPLAGIRQDIDARANAHINKALHFKRNDGLANHRAAYFILDGKIAFRGEARAHGIFTGLDL